MEMSTDELAFFTLMAAKANLSGGLIHDQRLEDVVLPPGLDRSTRAEASRAVLEAASWLQANGFLLRPFGYDGGKGWLMLSRKGEKVVGRAGFLRERYAALFPRDLLHISIVDTVWPLLSRGQYSLAVFAAFKQVEVSIRLAAGYDDSRHSTDMVRSAFNPNSGPLTDMSLPMPEREGLASLFAGAYGTYRNPHSHRNGEIRDVREAQEMVLLATHLLRILENRGLNKSNPNNP